MNLNLIDIVVKAGDILLEGLLRDVKANYKGKSDIVTEIDLKSEAFLKEELQKSSAPASSPMAGKKETAVDTSGERKLPPLQWV